MDAKSPAENVIDSLGGLTKVARAIGCPVSTVQGWKDRGRIPQDYWDRIIDAGLTLGVEITLRDFVYSAPPAAAPTGEVAA